MSNPDYDVCGDLHLTCSCAADPVPATVSKHRVTLHNTGLDKYIAVTMVVAIRAPVPTCGLTLHHAHAAGTALPVIGVGNLPSGTKANWNIDVQRVAGGTTRFEAIRTTVSFASEAETEPLDDVPVAPYICMTTVDVGIV